MIKAVEKLNDRQKEILFKTNELHKKCSQYQLEYQRLKEKLKSRTNTMIEKLSRPLCNLASLVLRKTRKNYERNGVIKTEFRRLRNT